MLASSELSPNMFGASSELASVMEFGFNSKDVFSIIRDVVQRNIVLLVTTVYHLDCLPYALYGIWYQYSAGIETSH